MVGLSILGVVVILADGRFQVALAFAIGAALGVLNFYWLWQTGLVLMEVQTARVPRMTVLLIILRYPLAFAGLFIIYYNRWLSPLPVIAGLLVPGGGVLVESLLLVRKDLRRNETA
jgi:hypothetical protein